ncbi:mannose-1-phosphate guanyltransferase [Candidatus Vecturithrix granuli]|uniref:Mannose-1-phosphate guanyltransferase n=1 Tax=Vecturithrix granuli TaxID=1499967 RepID=A0A081BXV3_VECG1|nr:mannose-1-phosphate guanyltransferase [Candidatus Vecturithrix granuli]
MQAIILAGGKGTRLKPFTTNFPKPLVPVDDTPILEIVLRQLKYYGFTEIILAVNHLAEIIMAFFGHGEKLGMNITYSLEDQPLGTAGPLSLIQNLHENFLVMNGDTLTTINYKQLFDYHVQQHNDVTISVYKKEVKIDLGVLETEGPRFQRYIEKPTYYFEVSMGIYVFHKEMIQNIPLGAYMDMPDLISKLHCLNKQVRCFRGEYYWLDIGRIEDYEKATDLFQERREQFLPSPVS